MRSSLLRVCLAGGSLLSLLVGACGPGTKERRIVLPSAGTDEGRRDGALGEARGDGPTFARDAATTAEEERRDGAPSSEAPRDAADEAESARRDAAATSVDAAPASPPCGGQFSFEVDLHGATATGDTVAPPALSLVRGDAGCGTGSLKATFGFANVERNYVAIALTVPGAAAADLGGRLFSCQFRRSAGSVAGARIWLQAFAEGQLIDSWEIFETWRRGREQLVPAGVRARRITLQIAPASYAASSWAGDVFIDDCRWR